MGTQDTCCTIAPYFKVHAGRLAPFKEMCEQFVAMIANGPKRPGVLPA